MFLSKLMPLNEAVSKLNDNQIIMDKETINIKDSYMRVLAEDIKSYYNSPPFDKSAMDGYAVIAENTFGASNNVHKTLKVIDHIGAGDYSDKEIHDGEAILIATGAPIPKGANAVIMSEYTSCDGDELSIHSQVTPGENISPKAEDIKEGQIVLKSNTLIRPQEIGLIASAGYNEIQVYKKPRVKIIVTGNELVEPSRDVDTKSKIINSNQYTISSMVESTGALVDVIHVYDVYDDVKEAIDNATKNYDLVITTGGTAISKGDVVLDAVDELGEILYHGVAMRPGKPAGAGVVNNTVVFTLSGQPVAAMSQFDVFVRTYLYRMEGLDYNFDIVKRESMLKIPSTLGRTDFIRTYSDHFHAKHVLNRGSGIIRSMVEANSYIIIDENNEGVEKGDMVDVVLFNTLNIEGL